MSKAKLLTGAASALIAGVASVGAWVQSYVPVESSELVQYQIKCNQAHAYHDLAVFEKSKGRKAFTDGEAHRPDITQKAYARLGIGIEGSLHGKRLARDKMLILNGVYSPRAEDYREAGELWEKIGKDFGVETAWGGRFNDANHFSCAWKGVK